MLRIKVLLVAVFLLGSASAYAHDLTLYAGYQHPGELTFDNVTEGLRVRGNGVYGARFGSNFLKVLGMEHTIAFSPNFVTGGPSGESDLKAFIYNSNLVLNIPIGRFVPYGTAGLGLIKPFGSDFRPFDTRFAVNYGGGLKLRRLAGPVGLRFDARGYSLPDVFSQTLNIFEVSAGVTFSFGGN